MPIGYALRAEHKESYAGGVLCVGSDGEAFDTALALQDGDGVIVVDDDDTGVLVALDAAPAFERVDVPKPKPAKKGKAVSDAD